MPSQVSICNQALMTVGAKVLIGAMDEDSDNARMCSAVWQDALDAVLRAHAWGCATSRQKLALASEQPLEGYIYRYRLPAEPYCLRVLGLDDKTQPWRIHAGRCLETDAVSPVLTYIGRVADPNTLDPLLAAALAARIAAELAYAITGVKSREDNCWRLYQAKLTEAAIIDAREHNEQSTVVSPSLDARL